MTVTAYDTTILPAAGARTDEVRDHGDISSLVSLGGEIDIAGTGLLAGTGAIRTTSLGEPRDTAVVGTKDGLRSIPVFRVRKQPLPVRVRGYAVWQREPPVNRAGPAGVRAGCRRTAIRQTVAGQPGPMSARAIAQLGPR
jgi:hypothetical protein